MKCETTQEKKRLGIRKDALENQMDKASTELKKASEALRKATSMNPNQFMEILTADADEGLGASTSKNNVLSDDETQRIAENVLIEGKITSGTFSTIEDDE